MNNNKIHAAWGFAACAHRHQVRKYTGEAYVTHCENVSLIVSNFVDDPDVATAAMLHDVVEDTPVGIGEIEKIFGKVVGDLVREITDVSKPIDGNRAIRKAMDREHLAKSSGYGASIKLADMIDNSHSIVKYDKDFARIYLREKELLLRVLKHGNRRLWGLAHNTLTKCYLELGMDYETQIYSFA